MTFLFFGPTGLVEHKTEDTLCWLLCACFPVDNRSLLFPQCTRCECNVAGSDSQTCDLERQVCACADGTGKCSCKVGTVLDARAGKLPDLGFTLEQRDLGASEPQRL